MDTLRNQVDLMNKIENGLLSERKKHLEQQIISAPVFLALLTVFSLCILLFAYRNVNSRIKELDAIRLELEQKNEALKEVNKDLESFAYISSHDLQEPLRKIRLFVDRLAEKEQDSISDEGKSYMVKIERAAKRMQQLIVDLLSFSKVTNKYEQFEDVDLRQLVSEVINELSEVIEEKEVTIEIGTMCNIQAIRYQIRQLMFNLIGNAIKFSKPYGKPHIKIVASHSFEDLKKDGAEKKQYCHVTISDNGVGFDAQYNDQIFQVFQRLHQKTKYEGTGIGLAIVKKVVENHNGYIEAHGKENEGATFDIWLPVG
jgi:light-regulated signal transduction histidine kinase (bacteriophytochrome)